MNQSNTNRPFEPWELSAFLLGELDVTEASRIEAAINSNAELAADVEHLRQTIGVVRDALAKEDAEIAVESANVASTGNARVQWIGLLALSACLVIAILWVSDLWTSPKALPIASTKSLSEIEREKAELQKKLEELKSELSSETISRRNARSTQDGTAPVSNGVPTTLKTGPEGSKVASEQDDVVFEGTDYGGDSAMEEIKSESLALGGRGAGPGMQPSKRGVYGGMGEGGMGEGGMEGGFGGGGMGGGEGGGYGGGMGGAMGGAMGGGRGGGKSSEAKGRGFNGGLGSLPSGIGGMGMSGEAQGMGMGSADAGTVQEDLLGDVQIEVVDSTGMIIVKGSKEDVEKAQKAIDDFKNLGAISDEDVVQRRRQQQAERLAPKPELNQARYTKFVENPYQLVSRQPLSTFSIDVDTASYAKCRQLLMEAGQVPPATAVRLEEFINYFDYNYQPPQGDVPFATHLAVAQCPWKPEHKLVRVALQTAKPNLEERAPANVVFLIDVSGSMSPANKLPLVKDAMRMMIEQLNKKDRVAMVVYAGAAGCVLEGTSGADQKTILSALDRLQAGGSTNGGQGIELAYQLARDQFIPGGNNRVILCTDGDFNVGVTSTDDLVNLVEKNAKSKIFLTVLGFGMDNTNDQMMKKISNRGNGVYGFVDSWREAKRQMVDQLAGNLITVAKDVKIQVEFNPEFVKAYRLLGYENRLLAARDFNDDTKDAGEIGAGHSVTALYEVVPANSTSGVEPEVDDLLFQPKSKNNKQESTAEHASTRESTESTKDEADAKSVAGSMLAVKLRYKHPEGDVSKKLIFPLANQEVRFQDVDRDFRWAASMAQFGMLLRNSRYAGNSTWSGLIEQAREAASGQSDLQREEAIQMMQRASQLKGGR